MADLNKIVIESATPDDSEAAAQLMYLAFDQFSHYLFATNKDEKILAYFGELWINQKERMSSRYSYVIRDDNKRPIALICCYDGVIASKLLFATFWAMVKIDPGIIPYLIFHPNYLYSLLKSPEAEKDEFYIFMLAVLPEFQNKKLGTQLLSFAQEKAKDLNFKKCSLLVRRKNIDAIRFYERNGFKIVRTYDRNPMDFYKMLKEL